MSLRRLLFHVHVYAGLGLGLLLSVTGLTGTALLFEHEANRLLDGHLWHAAPPSPAASRIGPQRALDVVRQAVPEGEVRFLVPPRKADGVYVAWLGDRRRAFVDPFRGELLGVRRPEETAVGLLLELHTRLLSGESGESVVGIGGVALLLLGATGVVLWWPGRRGMADGFRIRYRASWKRVTYDLHRVGGILVVALLTVVAATGIMLVWSVWFTDALQRLTRTPPRPKYAVRPPQGRSGPEAWLPLDELVRRAEAALPGGETTRITLPAKAGAPLVVRRRMPGEWHPNGTSAVYLDPHRGRVLGVEDARRAGAAARVLALRYPLHIGSYGGLPVRLLYAAVGLSPAALFVTGCLMWWNRTGAARRRKRRDGPRRARRRDARRLPPAGTPEPRGEERAPVPSAGV